MTDKIAKKILNMEKDKLMLQPESDRDWELISALDIAIENLERVTMTFGELRSYFRYNEYIVFEDLSRHVILAATKINTVSCHWDKYYIMNFYHIGDVLHIVLNLKCAKCAEVSKTLNDEITDIPKMCENCHYQSYANGFDDGYQLGMEGR